MSFVMLNKKVRTRERQAELDAALEDHYIKWERLYEEGKQKGVDDLMGHWTATSDAESSNDGIAGPQAETDIDVNDIPKLGIF